MSWSDDTRCLYCEGRLPLYRKITHGQFCSNGHRKSYWQEQERLAVERLQQAHSSLRSYRPLDVPQEAVPCAELEPVNPVRVASHLLLEQGPVLDPVPSIGASPYPIPDVSQTPVEASELLGLLAPDFLALEGSSPELIAADPFEYEISRPPLPPSHASGLGSSPLPEGLPVAPWSYLEPSSGTSTAGAVRNAAGAPKNAAGAATLAEVSKLELCHPRSQEPAARIQAAGRVGLPLAAALEDRPVAIATGSILQTLEMEPAPVTSIELKVPPQSDVLLQMLDQQVPHPDQLHALGPFTAHQQAFALAYLPPQQFDATPETALPAATPATAAADYQLVSGTKMLELSGAVPAAQGHFESRTAISEIAVSFETASSAVMPAVESVHQMGMAGLQRLAASLLRPAQGVFAFQTTNSVSFDLSMAVSSDVTYPRLNPVAADVEAPPVDRILPLTFAKKRKAAGDGSRVEPIARLLPEALETRPVLPHSGLEPLDRKPPQDALRKPQSVLGSLMRVEGLKNLEPAWAHATGFWQHAPRDLKLLLFTIPALLALVFHPGWPRVAFAAPQTSTSFTGNFKRVLNTGWENVHQTLENRAAVALDEDFRSGLDNWTSPGGSTTEWSFDATGFVRPGPLALYRPSVGLTDYQVQFLGLIDKKALSWVVRAADFENFYVVKLEVAKPGPMSALSLTRYAVINGKAQDRHDVKIPITAGPDTLYRVRMDVRDSEFTLEVQGQIADSWTETRLPRGGIGFFTAGGEASRVRWMQITHQYDMLGRLCAYLAPYDTTNGSWQP